MEHVALGIMIDGTTEADEEGIIEEGVGGVVNREAVDREVVDRETIGMMEQDMMEEDPMEDVRKIDMKEIDRWIVEQ